MFRRIAIAFGGSLGVLVCIIWLIEFLQRLDVVTTSGQSIWMFLIMTILALPAVIQIIAPIAFIIGLLMALSDLHSDSELTAITASGAPRRTILRPIGLAASMLTLFLYLSHLLVTPLSTSGLREMVYRVRADLISSAVQDGGFRSLEGGKLTLHIRERVADGSFAGIFVSDLRKEGESVQYVAARGALLERDRGAFLVLANGNIIREQAGNGSVNVVAFDTYAIDLSQFTQAAVSSSPSPKEITTRGLLEKITVAEGDPGKQISLNRELHERFSAPLYPLAFAAIIAAFVGRARANRNDIRLAIASGAGLCLVLRAAGMIALAVSGASAIAWTIFYAVPIAGFFAGLIGLWLNIRVHMPTGVIRLGRAIAARLPANLFARPAASGARES
ncbi:MAG: LptF/LptG family permease [Alphaproteobacteria bacterium]